MKEIINSITEVSKARLTNSLYGTFFVTWLVFHWNFIFSIFALSDDKILQMHGLLKNDYLIQHYFNVGDWYFWFSWVMPFIFTYIIIWKLPSWILLDAYGKTEEYEVGKKIIKIVQQRRVEQEKAKLEEQTAKKVTAVAKQVVEEKKIKEADPTKGWDEDYRVFKRLDFAYKFSKIIESYYKRKAEIIEYGGNFGEQVIFEIPEDILAYAHSNGIIEIDSNSNKINPTEKGKYFISRFLEDPNRPTESPF